MTFGEEKHPDSFRFFFTKKDSKSQKEKQLVIPYKKIQSLQRTEHENGPAIWIQLRNSPVKTIKVNGFHHRERAILDIVSAAAAVGVSISTMGTQT